MTLINNVDDFLNALDNNPAWLEAVRARILGKEVMQLPVRFDRFEKDFQEFREETKDNFARIDGTLTRHEEQLTEINGTLARHDEQFSEINATLARHDGYFNNLRGVDYEGQASAGAGRRLRSLLGARTWSQIEAKPQNGLSELGRLLNEAEIGGLGEEEDAIDDQAYLDILRVDLVYRLEFADGEHLMAAGEASVTVETQDVDRARRRAAAIEMMTGTTTMPFVIGAAITPEAAEAAEKPGETAVRWLQMDEAPDSG